MELDYLAEVSPEPEVVNVMVNILTIGALIKEGPKPTLIASKGSDVVMKYDAEGFPSPEISGVLMGPRQRLGTSTASTRRMGPHCHPGNHGGQWQVCVGVLGGRCPEPCVHLVQRRRAAHPVEAG